MIHIPFDNRFLQLGEPFFAKAHPAPVKQPALIQFNHALARELSKNKGTRLDFPNRSNQPRPSGMACFPRAIAGGS